MARKRTPGYDPRRIWSTNLAPLVAAAREGGNRAAHAASKERERARRKSQWWRQRWLYVTATGLVVAGAAGGVYQAVTKRRATAPEQPGTGPGQPGGTAADAIRSTVGTGRERVTDAARGMLHKIRRDEGPDQVAGTTTPAPDQARNQADVTRGVGG